MVPFCEDSWTSRGSRAISQLHFLHRIAPALDISGTLSKIRSTSSFYYINFSNGDALRLRDFDTVSALKRF